MKIMKAVAIPAAAAIAVASVQVAFYLTLLSVLAGSDYAFEQFELRKFYLLGLAISFGVQIGLFLYLRSTRRKSCSRKVVLVSGAASTTSMASCCAMHLVSVLPLIGASGIISTLGQYQVSLYWLGLLINLSVIAWMSTRALKVRRIMKKSITISLIAVAAVSLLALSCGSSDQSSAVSSNGAGQLQAQTNEDGSVSIAVTPGGIPSASSWNFKLALDTHMGELNNDLTKLGVMVVDGKEYKPVAWNVQDRGMMGHHVRGTLEFKAASAKPAKITLKIRNIGGINERSFVWNLSP